MGLFDCLMLLIRHFLDHIPAVRLKIYRAIMMGVARDAVISTSVAMVLFSPAVSCFNLIAVQHQRGVGGSLERLKQDSLGNGGGWGGISMYWKTRMTVEGTTPTVEGDSPDQVDLDVEAQLEAERIMQQLESGSGGHQAVHDETPKYQPSTEESDPIVQSLKSVLECQEVTGFELLDSRWNGNEALRYTTDRGIFFVKMNRVEDVSVFMTEVCFCFIFGSGEVILGHLLCSDGCCYSIAFV
ncbi:unnamed protein product [Choristocarpus tenellus]